MGPNRRNWPLALANLWARPNYQQQAMLGNTEFYTPFFDIREGVRPKAAQSESHHQGIAGAKKPLP